MPSAPDSSKLYNCLLYTSHCIICTIYGIKRYAYGYRQRHPDISFKSQFFDACSQLIRFHQRQTAILNVTHNDQKLIAADAADDIIDPELLADLIGDPAENLVTEQMPMPVVDHLKIINIQEHDLSLIHILLR